MRILIGAFGTRGDVQPMLALSRTLHARGHELTLCVPPNFVAWAEKFGLKAHGVGMDMEKFIADHGENVLGSVSTFKREIAAQIGGMLPFAADADLCLSAGICPMGTFFEEKYGKPGRFILFTPSLLPSAEYPPALVPWQRMPKWLNRAAWSMDAVLWNALLLGTLNEARGSMGLPKARDLWECVLGRKSVIATERLLASPSPAPGRVVEQTGAWFFDDPDPVPAEVEAFLATGPAPVFIGFGSMTDSRREETMERLLKALRLAGARAIIARGWAGFEPPQKGDPNVLVVGPTPHAKIFPRCAAVVHHGGAGTLHQAMRAGVPQIPAPHLLDQFFWSEQLERAGLSPGKQSRKKLDSEALAAAIGRCVEDDAMRARCRDMASRMTRDGVERMVGLAEKLGPLTG
jgi:UDP:flavonoid glycosyltransferase YjiC (YdhE family)